MRYPLIHFAVLFGIAPLALGGCAQMTGGNLQRQVDANEQAIRQMLFELRRSPGLGCSGVKLIHGYGSSGAGGRIRVEARRRLDRMKAGGEIWGYIPGEFFSIFDSDTLAAFQRCPTLRRDRDLERHNNGVTFVLL